MWYRAGTITVTADSNTVTGSGTEWVANLRVGDGLQGPDGRLYEITNIASNTALSIEPAYKGPTAAGQAYWTIPVQGYQKRLADRAAALVDEIGLLPGQVQTNTDNIATNTDNIAANTDDIAANDVRIANAIQEISALEAAALLKADNLSGLADLAQSRVSLGVVATLAAEVFSTDNCTVTTNSNGTSFRFPNGLQICFGAVDLTYSFARALEATWSFPQPFISAPGWASVSIRGNATNRINWPAAMEYVINQAYATLSSTSMIAALYSSNGVSWNSNSQATDVRVATMGFWK